MTRTFFHLLRQGATVLALWGGLVGIHARAEPVPPMKAVQVSPSVWYVEGVSALGSVANQNFISNAAFVVTPAGVVDRVYCRGRLMVEAGKAIVRGPFDGHAPA